MTTRANTSLVDHAQEAALAALVSLCVLSMFGSVFLLCWAMLHHARVTVVVLCFGAAAWQAVKRDVKAGYELRIGR